MRGYCQKEDQAVFRLAQNAEPFQIFLQIFDQVFVGQILFCLFGLFLA